MRAILACGAMGAAFLTAGAASATPSLEIKDAVARVTVVPEDRADIKVEVLKASAALPLKVRQVGERTIVDGELGHGRIHSCTQIGETIRVGVRGLGQVAYKDMPQVVIRTPRAVDVGAGGAVYGSVGRADSTQLSSAGCGDWTVANVKGALNLNLAGSGEIRTGTAATAGLKVAGSGHIVTQTIAGDATVSIAGSGDVTMAQALGDVNARIAGSGDIVVAGGRSQAVSISVAGSGDVVHKGWAASLDARIMGSGDARVAHVSGATHKSILGSGEVVVGP